MKKTFFSIFFLIISLFLGIPRVDAAVLSSNSVYVGDRITIEARDLLTTEDCLNSYRGLVTLAGRSLQITSWLSCIGYIEVVIPPGAQSGDLMMVKNRDTFFLGRVQVKNEPLITDIFPSSVIPGVTSVTINGSGFGNAWYDKSLFFGDVEADSVTKWTDGQIIAKVPVQASAARVYVVTPRGRMVQGPEYSLQPFIVDYSSADGVVPVGGTLIINGWFFKSALGPGNLRLRVSIHNQELRIIDWSDRRISVSMDRELSGPLKIEITSDSGKVASIEGKNIRSNPAITSDELSALQAYLLSIGMPAAWALKSSASDVIVAVIDDGVYINHPDLKDNIWRNSREVIGNRKDDDNNGYIDDVYGWDYISNVPEMTVRGTHGTMVAGIIGARGDNAIGISGVSKQVKLMPLIVCSSDGCPNPSKNIPRAIRYAVDNGAKVINMSLGSTMTTGYSDEYDSAIKYAYNKGVVIVAAAGNGDLEGGIGQDLGLIPQSPVCNDNSNNMVLGVGATTDTGARLSWSNYGICVDVYAPGARIVSTSVPAHSTLGGFYDVMTGTSFSAPMVSGVAALLKSSYPNMSNSEVYRRIMELSRSGFLDASRVLSGPIGGLSPMPETRANSTSALDQSTAPAAGRYVAAKKDSRLTVKMVGLILLQVESRGEAWYLVPSTLQRVYLRDGEAAYQLMRSLGLGITESDFAKLVTSDDIDGLRSGSNICSRNAFANRLKGRLLLRAQSRGEVYYIYPKNCRAIYLENGESAYRLMRMLGVGIKNADLEKIPSSP